jgi:hypothetical protein
MIYSNVKGISSAVFKYLKVEYQSRRYYTSVAFICMGGFQAFTPLLQKVKLQNNILLTNFLSTSLLMLSSNWKDIHPLASKSSMIK